MKVRVEAWDEPLVQNLEPSFHLHPVNGGEDGEESVVKRFAALALLR